MVLEGVLVSVVQRLIGRFVDGLDTKSLKLSIWKGKVVLKDVQLRPDALYSLGLPLSVRSGSIERLTLDIPWRRLGKEPVIVHAAGVPTRPPLRLFLPLESLSRRPWQG